MAKILVVDDEQDLLTFMKTFLEDNGYQVITAEDGKQAFEKASHPTVPYVILELKHLIRKELDDVS